MCRPNQASFPEVNLSAYFLEDLWSRERTYLVFGTHFGAERGCKTIWAIQCLRYQLFFGVHWRTILLCSKKCLAVSSAEIHPGVFQPGSGWKT